MKIFKKYRTLWMMGVIVVLAILFITNFSYVVSGIDILLRSITSLLGGAALAFVLNLIMCPVEDRLKKSDKPFVKNHARALAILTSFLVMFLIIILILSIIIPNLISALRMLTSEAPEYFNEVETLLQKLLHNYPSLLEKLKANPIDWDQTFEVIVRFLTNGSGGSNVMDSTMNLVSSFVSFFVNTFVVVIFASYVLAEKERFVKGYYTFVDLYVSKPKRTHLTRDLRIVNDSFKSFILGEIIEAAILSTMCIVGMLILQLPYATMIGILVGVINMIPMVGAFIGGGIGAFIIFTISPTKCLIFLIFLCIIQQIESNVFFPRVIGNKVGLPGIYVMMTIVVGGTLFGVLGMILGVPLMASVYKIAKIDLAELKARREQEQEREKESNEKGQKNASKNVVQKMRSEMMELRKSVDENPQAQVEVEQMIRDDEDLRRRLDALLCAYDMTDEDIRPSSPANLESPTKEEREDLQKNAEAASKALSQVSDSSEKSAASIKPSEPSNPVKEPNPAKDADPAKDPEPAQNAAPVKNDSSSK